MTILARIFFANLHALCSQYAALLMRPPLRGSRDGISPRLCAEPGASGYTLADQLADTFPQPMVSLDVSGPSDLGNPEALSPHCPSSYSSFATVEVSELWCMCMS